MTDQTLLKLRELLLNEFSEDELVALCKDIGISYEALPGTGTFGKTRELVETARSQDKLRALQSRLRELRPDAYAAAGITPATGAVVREDTTVPVSSTRSVGSTGSTRFPWLWIAAPLLLLLLCVVLALAVLLPRSATPPAPPATAAALQPTTASTAGLISATPVETVQGVAQDQVSPTTGAAVIIEPAQTPVGSVAGDVTPTSAQSVSTAQPIVTSTVAAGAVPTQTVAATAVPGPTPTPTVSETHPAAQNIRGLNDQLPLFYSGKASAKDLENFWTGDALRAVTGFGDVRLPRAMRLQSSQRDALEVTFQYLRPPVIISQLPNGVIVTSRESWHYGNSLNATQFCEVRDYIYNMIKDGDHYRVRQFQSRLVESGCKSQ